MRRLIILTFLLLSKIVLGQQVPNALNFDGTNDYISLGNSSKLRPATITVETKVNLVSWNATGNMAIVSNSATQGYYLKYQSGTIVVGVQYNGIFKTISSNVRNLSSGWHTIAFTYDGFIIRLYIDSNEKTYSGKSKIFYPIVYDSNVNVIIGANSAANGQFFKGTIDEVRFWNGALIPSQLINITSEVLPNSTNLIAYYRFNQGIAGYSNSSIIEAKDLTANLLHGKLFNFALNGNTSNWVLGQALTPANQSLNIIAINGTSHNSKISWSRAGQNKGGNAVAVFVSKTSSGTASPVDNFTYTANTVYGNGSQIGTSGWYCIYNGSDSSVNLTGLSEGQSYRAQVFEYQYVSNTIRYNLQTATNNPNSFTYFIPQIQASNISFSKIGYYGSTISWTRGNGSGVAVFLIEGNLSATVPVNSTSYTADPNFKSGGQIGSSGWHCIYTGTGNNVIINSLLPGRNYKAVVYEYSGTPGSEKYLTTISSGNSGSFATNDFFSPSVQVSNLSITDYATTSINLNWKRGNGAKTIIFAKQTNDGVPSPVNNLTYAANSNFGLGTQINSSGWFCVYNDTATNTLITGLSTGSDYKFVAFEYNGSALAEKYQNTIATNVITGKPDYKAPTILASDILVNEKTISTLQLSWTKGNGENCLVLIAPENSGEILLNNNTTYSAGALINATNWTCVYNGNGNSVQVSNLNTNTTYQIAVVEYNGESGLEKYGIRSFIVTSTLPFSTSWNGQNWTNGMPNKLVNAIIEANFSIAENIACKDLTVNANVSLNIQPGNAITIFGNLTNNGTIQLISPVNSGASGSFINYGSITNNGKMIAERYISPGTTESTNKHWHLMSSPNSGQLVETVFTGDYVSKYVESSNTWTNMQSGSVIVTGTGIMVKTVKVGGKKAIFSGTFNSGNYSYSLKNTGPNASHGYNLVGNPYPSAINWDANGWTKQDISNTIWIWDPVYQRYMTWNGSIGQNGGSSYIPSMQAFFVKVNDNATSGILGFTNSTRLHSSVNYQKNSKTNSEKLRLVTSGNNLSDELVIYTDNSDNDVIKLYSDNSMIPQIAAVSDNESYAIYKVSDDLSDKKIGIRMSCAQNGQYTLNVKEIDFASYKSVLLTDRLTQTTIDLKSEKNYTFLYQISDDPNRFDLLLSQNDVNTSISTTSVNNAKIWSDHKMIFVDLTDASNYMLEVFTIDGKKEVSRMISGQGFHAIEMSNRGIYLVKLQNAKGSIIKKLSIF